MPVWAKPVDFSSPNLLGLWTPCAGSVSPWGSHLSSEEYEPDAFCIYSATSFDGPESTAMTKCTDPIYIAAMMNYFFPTGDFTLQDIQNTSTFKPYMVRANIPYTPSNNAFSSSGGHSVRWGVTLCRA